MFLKSIVRAVVRTCFQNNKHYKSSTCFKNKVSFLFLGNTYIHTHTHILTCIHTYIYLKLMLIWVLFQVVWIQLLIFCSQSLCWSMKTTQTHKHCSSTKTTQTHTHTHQNIQGVHLLHTHTHAHTMLFFIEFNL